jgi:hypothetical protein
MAYGIKAANATSSTDPLVAVPCEVLGVHWRAGATAGTIVLRDGGVAFMTINTPAAVSAGFVSTMDAKGNGMICQTDLDVVLTTADGVTVIYK